MYQPATRAESPAAAWRHGGAGGGQGCVVLALHQGKKHLEQNSVRKDKLRFGSVKLGSKQDVLIHGELQGQP